MSMGSREREMIYLNAFLTLALTPARRQGPGRAGDGARARGLWALCQSPGHRHAASLSLALAWKCDNLVNKSDVYCTLEVIIELNVELTIDC